MKEIVVCGNGGHAKVVLSLLKLRGLAVPYLLAEQPDEGLDSIHGVPVRGPLTLLPDRSDTWAFLAMEDNQKRAEVAQRFANVNWVTLIHPTAWVDPSARIGPGTYVAAGACVNAEAVVGRHVIIEAGASVGHDCILEDFVQVESGVRLGGGARLGRGAQCGIGSAVVPNCFIGAGAILGPRSVAVQPVPAGESAVGVPARPTAHSPGAAAPLPPNRPNILPGRRSITLLISSAGRRVELIRCFQADAQALGLNLRVLAVDVEPQMSSACQAADACFQVPPCSSPEFTSRLLQICEREHVNLIVPTIDPELPIFADQKAPFAAIGTRIIVSSPAVVRMAGDKAATAEFFRQNGLPSPRTAPLAQLLLQPAAWPWPLILKPIHGSASMGVCVVKNIEEARRAAGRRDDYVAQELVRGREYTVNLFFDQAGNLRSVVPHERCEVRSGEVSKGITRRDSRFMELARQLGAVLSGAVGPLCFQAITPESGPPVVFEINARFGGGYPLAHQAGATFTRWLLEEIAGLPSSAHDQWEDGLTMLRYDAALFHRATPAL